MKLQIKALFEYVRNQITEQHIQDYSPSDPGYHDYVRVWTKLLQSGQIPQQTDFELTEVINLTGWGNPVDYDDPEAFRAYRRFTTCVAWGLISHGQTAEYIRPMNYLAYDLVTDCLPTNHQYFSLVRDLLPSLRDYLNNSQDEVEYPFLTLAALILADRAGDHNEVTRLAIELIEEEANIRHDERFRYGVRHDSQFLFGRTVYEQRQEGWIFWTKGVSNPSKDINVQLILEAFSQMSK
ncbi:hypothetical protein DTL42_05650 [Bremerella cremea]|uniref:Uncharacterized protein n=1 Tax=Bremerella cremea TaxID=1031537 RepID=A0A368KW17_9BACT|nr:hypothetical protein [Bremerella cremea]RCS54618.1 hypothetical protein DTL42_05650 [Bremerella cremea]